MILFEDDHLLVAHKNAGISTTNEPNEQSSLLSQLSVNHTLWPINRIDKRVSGMVLFAKTEKAAGALGAILTTPKIVKKYKAIVPLTNLPAKGLLVNLLKKDTKQKKAYLTTKEDPMAKTAQLYYEIIQKTERYMMLEITLKTGRFHQIRAQLAAIGAPIVGDLKYGAKRSSPDGSIFLQSYFLSFVHPYTNQTMVFELPQPEIWKKYGF